MKKSVVILFTLFFIIGCEVGFPNLAHTGKDMKVIGDSMACALSGFFGGHTEKINVTIPIEFIKKDFAPLVGGIKIKTSSTESEKVLTASVRAQLENYVSEARQKMHSAEFYYKFLVRSLIHVANSKKIYDHWRLSQVEYKKVNEKQTEVVQFGLELEVVGGQDLTSKEVKEGSNRVGFCDPL